MLILQITLQILIGLVAFVTVLLDHRWRDRRTNLHRSMFRSLLCLLACICLLSVGATILETQQTEQSARQLTEDLRALKTTNASLAAQVEEVTSWNASFRPLTETQTKSLRSQLAKIQRKHGLDALPIRFQCETGSGPRTLLGQELGWLFELIGAGHFQPGTFTGFNPGAAIEVSCPSNSLPYVDAVANALSTVIEGEIRLNPNPAGGMITAHINGTPMFRVDGRVKFQ